MRWLVLLALAGCGDSVPGADAALPPFTVHLNLGWSASYTPDVVAVTVDGAPLASDAQYAVNESYASYADAVGSFAPRSVVVMTSSGSATDLLKIGYCSELPQTELKRLGRLIDETDEYGVESMYGLAWYMRTCTGIDGASAEATRRARTR